MQRYRVERTNKAEIRPEEQRKKAESCLEKLWDEIQLKGPKRETQTQEQNKQKWASSVGLFQKRKPQTSPPLVVKVSKQGPADRRTKYKGVTMLAEHRAPGTRQFR